MIANLINPPVTMNIKLVCRAFLALAGGVSVPSDFSRFPPWNHRNTILHSGRWKHPSLVQSKVQNNKGEIVHRTAAFLILAGAINHPYRGGSRELFHSSQRYSFTFWSYFTNRSFSSGRYVSKRRINANKNTWMLAGVYTNKVRNWYIMWICAWCQHSFLFKCLITFPHNLEFGSLKRTGSRQACWNIWKA